jgi:protein involved in polysaccharide export with SLBB domain
MLKRGQGAGRRVPTEWVRAMALGAVLSLMLSLGTALAEKEQPEDKPQAEVVVPVKVPEAYKLQPGDKITVSVLPQKDYDTEECTILPDGKASFKGVGEVKAAGLTLKELQEYIKKVLEEELVDPRVTVSVTSLRSPLAPPRVTVSGAVGKPGAVNLEAGLRVRKAIDLAEGANKDADLSRVTIIHKNLTRSIVDLSRRETVIDPAHNRELTDGDLVEVPLLPRISVGGAVEKPGLVELRDGLTVRGAIDEVGGSTKEADLTQVIITHRDRKQTVVDISNSARLADPKHNITLEAGDIVDIPLRHKPGYVTIAGEVDKGGAFELKPGMGVEDLIVAAGKLTLLADHEHIQLRRKDKPVRTIHLQAQLKSGEKIVLEPGDEVLVPKMEDTVLVIAPIEKPGPRALKPGVKIKEFLQDPLMNIPLDTSKVDLSKTQIIRQGQGTIRVDLKRALKDGAGKFNVALLPGDVLFMPPRSAVDKPSTLMEALRSVPYVGILAPFFKSN